MIRYWDYNPSYSHPGMPMSTPVPFNQFVIPRTPNITMPQNQWVTPYVSNRRDSSGNLLQQQNYQGGGGFSGGSGFSGGGGIPSTINPMSSPFTWGVQSAINQALNPMRQEPSMGGPPMMSPPVPYQSSYSPVFRQTRAWTLPPTGYKPQYISPFDRETEGLPSWLKYLLR